MAIISLTSVPPRFKRLEDTLASLVQQTEKNLEIRVYIPKSYRRFPEWNGITPDLPSSIELKQVEDDFGPASKVLHAVRDEQGQSTPILFCDDDRIYHRTWAESLIKAHSAKPDCCIAIRGRHIHDIISQSPLDLRGERADLHGYFDPSYKLQRMAQRVRQLRLKPRGGRPFRGQASKSGYTEILLGYAGAVVLPRFFDEAAFSIPDDVWMVDDIWLSGQLARQDIPIWIPKGLKVCKKTGNDPVAALRDSVFEGADRRDSNRRAIRYFQDVHAIWLPPKTGG